MGVSQLLSLVLVPLRHFGQGGPYHRHLPGARESVGRALLAELPLGITVSCQTGTFVVFPLTP